MANQEILDRLDALIQGRLSEDEAKSILSEINNDPKLKAEHELRKLEHVSMDLLLEDDLREDFKKWDSEEKKTAQPRVVSLRRFIVPVSLAASFLLIAGFFVQSGNYNNTSIASRYDDVDFSGLRAPTGTSDAFDNVENILKNKMTEEYPRLEKVLSAIPTENPNYERARYYLGHLKYQQKDFMNAVASFEEVINSSQSEDAQWYKTLSFLKADQTTEASRVLGEILTIEGHKHHGRASQVEKELNSFWRILKD